MKIINPYKDVDKKKYNPPSYHDIPFQEIPLFMLNKKPKGSTSNPFRQDIIKQTDVRRSLNAHKQKTQPFEARQSLRNIEQMRKQHNRQRLPKMESIDYLGILDNCKCLLRLENAPLPPIGGPLDPNPNKSILRNTPLMKLYTKKPEKNEEKINLKPYHPNKDRLPTRSVNWTNRGAV